MPYNFQNFVNKKSFETVSELSSNSFQPSDSDTIKVKIKSA